MFKYTVFLVVMASVPALATPIPTYTWSGAGPNACDGRCTVDWATALLDDSRKEQLRKTQEAHPLPKAMQVTNGQTFSLMTYYKADKPMAQRGTTVAVLDKPAGAMGWRMNGWSFVRMDDCLNWAVLEHSGTFKQETTPIKSYLSDYTEIGEQISKHNWVRGGQVHHNVTGGTNYVDVYDPWDVDRPKNPPIFEDPNPVPVPATLPLLLGALGLLGYKMKRNYKNV